MKILGLIPARGGSKGVPKKNIKPLVGKPLIAYTIEESKKSKLLNKTILSSDSLEIIEVAKKYDLEVPFIRPNYLAKDNSGTLEVIKHTLSFFEEKGEFFDAICLLQVTSPYRPNNSIDKAIELFIKEKPDSLISVRAIPDEFNPHWSFKIEKNNRLKIATGENKIIPRRQELPKAYHRDGAIYITSTKTLKEKNSILGDDIIAFPIDSPKLINIDTLEDWKEAEEFYKSLKED